MIVCADYLKIFTITLLNLMSEFKQDQKTQNSIVFLYTIDDQVENTIKIPFAIASNP